MPTCMGQHFLVRLQGLKCTLLLGKRFPKQGLDPFSVNYPRYVLCSLAKTSSQNNCIRINMLPKNKIGIPWTAYLSSKRWWCTSCHCTQNFCSIGMHFRRILLGKNLQHKLFCQEILIQQRERNWAEGKFCINPSNIIEE